jgi:hypothetical protein
MKVAMAAIRTASQLTSMLVVTSVASINHSARPATVN